MGDAAAADEKGGVDSRQVPAQGAQVGREVLGGAGDIQLVSHPGYKVSVGDDHLSLPLRGGEEDRQTAGPTEKVGQRNPHHRVSLLHANAQHLHLSPEKGVHVGRGWEAEQPGNLQGGGIFRVDDRVDVQVLLQGGQVVGVGQVPNAGDGELGAQTLGGEGAEHVDLVQVGGGQDQIGVLHPGLPQHGGSGARALDAHHIQGVAGPVDGGVVLVDDGHVVVFPGEIGGQSGAHLARPDDKNVQSRSAFPKAGGNPLK